MRQHQVYPSPVSGQKTVARSPQRSKRGLNKQHRLYGLTPRHFILAIMAAAVLLLCLFKGNSSPLISGLPLKDTDDAMRLVQVIDLIDGAGWHDLTQERVNPPIGLSMHWSRLPDLPLAGAILIAQRFTDRQDAVLLATKLVPPLLGVTFFIAFVWAARPITGRNGELFAGLVGLALMIPLIQFAAGRVDHHGWQLILAMVTVGAMVRVITAQRQGASAIVGGIAGSLGLWVGAEALPWLGLAAGALALHWVREGRTAADAMAVFGITLAAGTSLLMPLALSPSQWGVVACDGFSVSSVGVAGTLALFGIGAAATERTGFLTGQRSRLFMCGTLGTLGLVTLYLLFPACGQGPYSQMSPDIAFWIEQVNEARRFTAVAASDPVLAAAMIVLPALALIIAAWQSARTAGQERSLWLGLALFVAGGMAVQLWQIRGTHLANAYAGLPFAWMVARIGHWADQMSMALTRVLLRLVPPVVLAILPATAALIAAKATGEALTADSKDQASAPVCEARTIATALNRLGADRGPLLIAAPIDLGPTLLLLTPHQVLAAPYHRNTEGLRDIHRLLYADEASAAEVVRRRGVDVVLVCQDDRLAEDAREDGVEPFADQLRSGEVPDWLRRVNVEGTGLLFVVEQK